ncbi:hypothetical protein RCL_jg21789.t1 [Rhizophagus clarus]|uniref:Uncharacterized protein n=1 Tax=Rhizophagus clarus TaxID=94130 RepID=A0A8H3QGI7_9GLOM|nr:hypothetical protein RCL_jg21789.t1 [Rhizophagus clarus]
MWGIKEMACRKFADISKLFSLVLRKSYNQSKGTIIIIIKFSDNFIPSLIVLRTIFIAIDEIELNLVLKIMNL